MYLKTVSIQVFICSNFPYYSPSIFLQVEDCKKSIISGRRTKIIQLVLFGACLQTVKASYKKLTLDKCQLEINFFMQKHDEGIINTGYF